MANRMTDAEIEEFLNRSDYDDNDESDAQEDVCDNSDHDSETEIEETDDEIAEYRSRSGHLWSDTYKSTKTRNHNIIRSSYSGPVGQALNCQHPIDCFNLFITSDILDLIVTHTNERIRINQKKYNKLESFIHETDRDEIEAFIGLLYLSGSVKSSKESISSLWRRDGLCKPVFPATMSERRFIFLMQNIRFDNSITREIRLETDKLAHIRIIWDIFRLKCSKYYVLSDSVTIDEMLRGFRQYMPRKPDKYGIKIFCMADAHSHYLYNAIIYTGKAINQPKNINISQEIVLKLTGNKI